MVIYEKINDTWEIQIIFFTESIESRNLKTIIFQMCVVWKLFQNIRRSFLK